MSIPETNLDSLLEHVPSCELEGSKRVKIAHITQDSRKVRKGSLFVAISGTQFDGNEYVDEALHRGAKAIVSERKVKLPADITGIWVANAREALAEIAAAFYGNPCRDLRVIGVTGTNGKTSVCYLLQAILKAAGWKTGRFGTTGHDLGRRNLPARMTTPESLQLQEMLSELKSSGYDSVVMEVSSHALEQERVRGIRFRVGIYTNLSQDHLDYHIDMTDYLEAKKKLFQKLDPDALGVVNLDDAHGREMVENVKCRFVTYGLENDAEVTARDVVSSLNGTAFLLVTPKGQAETNLSIGGDFNVSNFLAAAAAAQGLGVGLEAIVRGAAQIEGVPGRAEVIESPKGKIMVDYAHTPGALEALLSWAARYTEGQLLVLFGAGGDRDRTKRPLMGEVACSLADRIILTSDNPRSEDPNEIVSDILTGIDSEKRLRVDVVLDRREAIRHGIEILEEKDTLIIAGKGHERVQVFHRQEVPFDDRETVKEVLRSAG